MNETQISDLIKDLILSYKKASEKDEDSFTLNEEEYTENLDESLKQERKIKQELIKNITIEEKKEILKSISNDFIKENNIPKNNYGSGEFEELIACIITSLNDEAFLNSLILSDKFISSFNYSIIIINVILDKIKDEKIINEFLIKFKKYSKNQDKSLWENILLRIFNNVNFSFTFKEKLLEDNYKYVGEYFFGEVLKNSILSSEEKKSLIKSAFLKNISFCNLIEQLAGLCVNYEDAEQIVKNKNLINKDNIALFIGNLSLQDNDFIKLISNKIVYSLLDEYALEFILLNINIDFVNYKEFIFSDKIFAKLSNRVLNEILFSARLTFEQRKELISNKQYFTKMISNKEDFITAFVASSMSIRDKLKFLKLDIIRPFITDMMIESVYNSLEADLFVKNEILFDKQLFSFLIKDSSKYDKYEYLKKLYEKNPKIGKTLDLDLLNDDILDLDFELVELLGKNNELASEVKMKIENTDLSILQNLYRALKRIKGLDEFTIINYILKIVKIINNPFYSKILHSDLSPAQWQILLEVGLKDFNSLNILPKIENLADLNNFEENRILLCDTKFYDAIREGNLEVAQNAYFNKFLGININEANEIKKTYGTSLSEFKNNPEYAKEIFYLMNINKILQTEDLDVLCNYFNSQNNVISLAERLLIEQNIKKMFTQDLTDNVFKTKDGIQKNLELMVDDEKEQIPVYDAGLDFKMLVSNELADRGKINVSLIANDYLSIALKDDILFGYQNFELSNSTQDKPIFMSAQDIINSSRNLKNSRFINLLNESNNYIVINSYMSNEKKLKALEYSSKLSIPIVYLDIEKILKNEKRKIDTLIQEFTITSSLTTKINLLRQILVSHENNRSGLKAKSGELLAEYFPTDKITNLFKELVEQIKNDFLINNDIGNYQKYADMLLDVIAEEELKFNLAYESLNEVETIDIPFGDLKKAIMSPINEYLSMNNVPKLETVFRDIQTTHKETSTSKILEEVDIKLIEEMILKAMKQGYYILDLPLANVGHIERTMTLAYLIGKNELESKEDIQMLLTAALYHDCAKENDNHNPFHGKRSSFDMLASLDSKLFNEEQKKTLKLMVDYHDDIDLVNNIEMFIKRGKISPSLIEYCKKMAFALQDANWLDRKNANDFTQLNNSLHLLEAKKLINVAKELKEYYRVIDRKMFDKLCNDMILSQENDLSKGRLEK